MSAVPLFSILKKILRRTRQNGEFFSRRKETRKVAVLGNLLSFLSLFNMNLRYNNHSSRVPCYLFLYKTWEARWDMEFNPQVPGCRA